MILSFSGCHDQVLVKYPKTSLNPKVFWKNKKDVLASVNQLYTELKGMQRRAGWTDFMVGPPFANLKISGNIIPSITAGSGLALDNIWDGYYEGIAACNWFLENVEKADISSTLMARVKAEARFIRAFIYMELVMEFGHVPLVKTTLTREEGFNVDQVKPDVIWDFIESELSDIYLDLPIKYNSSNTGRITRGAAMALKAKTMLYAGRYEKAYKAAKYVIDMGAYSLYPDFKELFTYKAENSSAIILSRNYIKDDVSNQAFWMYAPLSMSFAHQIDYRATLNLVSKFQMQPTGLSINASGSGFNPYNPYQNRDPRLEATVFIPAFSDTTEAFRLWTTGKKLDPRPGSGTMDEVLVNKSRSSTGFYARKYVSKKDLDEPQNGGINYIIMRYAEVLLIASEALIELNRNLPQARKYINMVRSRAEMPKLRTSINTQSELRKAVRHERAVELALEGWRLYDIKRWGIADEIISGPVYGMTYLTEQGEIDTVKTSITMNWRQKDYLLPIPAEEIEMNKNLEQNPGYN